MVRRSYTDRSSNDPRGVARDGVAPWGDACSGFCTWVWVSARAAVEAATRVAELGDWIDGVNAERLLGEIMGRTVATHG
ncbi:hypothetical protein [Acidisphaera sp. L21]|jgi:hypothetical protein|uniref:hypothetical protein n=1 Tax=Acidisphaera sp. L21 TaxID=1641851 RepID=UPI00131AFC72|nr:hypothetical protein [Acidisphaera sp. L21]